MATELKIDTREFEAALKKYIMVSKRDLAYIVNKRALNVAFHAIRETPKARKGAIRRELLAPSRESPSAPIAALIINRRLGKAQAEFVNQYNQKSQQLRGLHGAEMRAAIQKLIKKRQNTIGYIRSGWLKAIHVLKRVTKDSKRPPRVNVFGRVEGDVRPAKSGINPTAVIINSTRAAVKIGAAGLAKAIALDAADMREFTAKRLQKTANRFNAR